MWLIPPSPRCRLAQVTTPRNLSWKCWKAPATPPTSTPRRPPTPAAYAGFLGAALAHGWEGFTGRVVPREPAHPRDVPEKYVMRPFDVRLAYLGKPWCTVPLEVGDADDADWVDLEDAAAAFATLGFPSPGRAPLIRLRAAPRVRVRAVVPRHPRPASPHPLVQHPAVG